MKGNFTLLFTCLLLFTFFTKSIAQNHSKESKIIAADAQEFYESGNYKQALELYRKAEKIHPRDPHFSFSIAMCYIQMGYTNEALPYLLIAQSGGIKYPKLLFYLGKSYHASLQLDSALAYFEKYKFSLSPKDEENITKVDRLIRYCNNAKDLIKNPVKVKITNLGEKINSEYPEYSPIISADEEIMFFTSRRSNSIGGKKDPLDGNYYEDIYIDVKSLNEWTTPTHLSNIINSDKHEASIALNTDGSQLFIYNQNNGGDIYVSYLKGNIWTEPKSVGTNINSEYWEPSASISPDGNSLFFVSDRPGGKGGTDIYLSQRMANGEFGLPILLNDKINTGENELSPYLHPDGTTLYFSSKGLNSMGGYDIFYCTINPKSGEVLSEVKNMGYPINTSEDEFNFVFSADNKRAYFSSIREGGFGDQDIYKMEIEENKDVHVVLLKGKIQNCINQENIHADIIVTDKDLQTEVGHYTSNAITGKYILALPGGKNYDITINAKDYTFYSKNINVPATEKYQEIEDTICLNNLKPGVLLKLKNITFEGNKLNLTDINSLAELDRLVQLLNVNGNFRININVHSDSNGDDKKNVVITEEKAKSLRDYIISKNIASSRIFYKGYGESKPLVPENNPEFVKINNRIEIEFLK